MGAYAKMSSLLEIQYILRWDRVFHAPKRIRNPKNPTLDIGFDSEYTNNKLLTYQFSTLKDGKLITKIYYINEPSIKSQDFLDLVIDFIETNNLTIHHNTVYLLSHASTAEIRFIDDYRKVFKLRTYGDRALGWKAKTQDGLEVQVIDTYGYFRRSLEKIGELIGYPKYTLNGLGGKSERYWKENMEKLIKEYPKEFETYAKRDSEICILLFEEIKKKWLPRRVDPHSRHTLPSLAIGYFIAKYYNHERPPQPQEEEKIIHRYRYKGEYRASFAKEKVLASTYDLNIRRHAMLSSFGAINQAYYRGHLTKENFESMVDLDFEALYPNSAIWQSLPNCLTKWEKAPDIKTIIKRNLQGYIHIKFKYPSNHFYTSLPVRATTLLRLHFPLEGETWVTCEETKIASQQGAKIEVLNGRVFEPTENEEEHMLKPFMQEIIKWKKNAKKGTLEYEEAKMLMNTLIGKFLQKTEPYPLDEIQEISLQYDDQELFQRIMRTREKAKFKKHCEAGSTWCPEWFSLILGKARSIMAQIIPHQCVTISTDGGIFTLEGWKEIRKSKWGKYMKIEAQVDELLIVRDRFACGWYQGKPSFEHQHGVHLNNMDEIWQWVKKGIENPKGPPKIYHTLRLVKVKEAIEKGLRPFDERNIEMKWNWVWNDKRYIPLHHKLYSNPFLGGWVKAEPWKNGQEILNFMKMKKLISTKRKLTPKQIEEAKKLKIRGEGIKEIAKVLGVSKMTLYRDPRLESYFDLYEIG